MTTGPPAAGAAPTEQDRNADPSSQPPARTPPTKAHRQSPVGTGGQVRQLRQGVGIGDRQVVGREDADVSSPIQRVLQGPQDAGKAALHDERHRHVDAVKGRVAQPVEQLRQQPAILRTVVEHRRAVTPNRTIRLHGASGTRALLARGWFSRQHSFGLYVASIP